MASKNKQPTKLARLSKTILVSFVLTLLPTFIWVFVLGIMMDLGFASIDNGPSQYIDVVYRVGVVSFILVGLIVYKIEKVKNHPST